MASYGIWLRSYIHIIQWEDSHKNCLEVRPKGADFWTVVFSIDLTGKR